jgi:hypothetical protein
MIKSIRERNDKRNGGGGQEFPVKSTPATFIIACAPFDVATFSPLHHNNKRISKKNVVIKDF